MAAASPRTAARARIGPAPGPGGSFTLEVVRRDSAVDDQHAAVDPGRLVGGEIEGHLDDVLGPAEPAHRDPVQPTRATNEAMLMIEPPPARRSSGMPCLQQR